MKSGSRRVILVSVCILKDHVTVFIVGSDQTESNWPPSRTALTFCSKEILQPNKMSDIWTIHTARRRHCVVHNFLGSLCRIKVMNTNPLQIFQPLKIPTSWILFWWHVIYQCPWICVPSGCLQLKMQKSDSLSYILFCFWQVVPFKNVCFICLLYNAGAL